MMQQFFTPGPSALFYTVENHLKQALKEQIPSISHRSKKFQTIYQECEENLRTLLDIPPQYHILFLSSATEIWERIILSLVEKQSFHLCYGSFSSRFAEISGECQKIVRKMEKEAGQAVEPSEIKLEEQDELFALTLNETSTGVHYPEEWIQQLRKQYPKPLIALDVVSAIPLIPFPMEAVDTFYFSVQKCFGLPAGLGVWVVNDRAIEKHHQLREKGLFTGTYHSLAGLLEKGEKHQTPETPNVLAIYLLAKVAGDMLQIGRKKMRNDAIYKSTLLYQCYEESQKFSPFVKDKQLRSTTVAIAECQGGSNEVVELLKSKGITVGSGYGPFKNEHIRVANFPTHSREQIEMLVDQLKAMDEG